MLLGGIAPASVARAAKIVPHAPTEVTNRTFLFEITRHAYRWHLEEKDVEKIDRKKPFVFWVRALDVKLDAGDNSRYAEILIPAFGLSVKVKDSNYQIEETGTQVRSRGFKISTILKKDLPSKAPKDCVVITVKFEEMKDYLFKTRMQHDPLDVSLRKRLGGALRKEMGAAAQTVTGEQTFYVAPLSPVANEVWAFWENRHMLVWFGSDIDLTNPEVWKQEELLARTFDLEKQVVLTLDEVPGSNRFMTRGQIGQVLFNCVVLGEKLAVRPESAGNTGEK
jgi:hypothetical protein